MSDLIHNATLTIEGRPESAPGHGPTGAAADASATEATGAGYWRSLEELADSEQFRQFVDREFADYEPEAFLASTRRTFLKIMAASVALAGLSGCRRWPQRQLAPYAERPEGRTPGETERYATSMAYGSAALPLLVTAFDGRPIKVEGNPDHPASGGAADLIAQASVLDLYDPHRARKAWKRDGENRAWAEPIEVDRLIEAIAARAEQTRGASLAVLAEAMSSPTVARLRRALKQRWPQMRWVTHEPLGESAALEGARLAFGEPVRTHYEIDQAEVILALDHDFMMDGAEGVRLTRQWARSRAGVDEYKLSRLYVAESTHSVTGSNADVRMPLRPTEIETLARELLAAVEKRMYPTGESRFARLARDLMTHPGKAVVTVGPGQPAKVHALVHAINAAIGAVGKTVRYSRVEDEGADGDIPAGVEHLLVLGGNPVYDGSAALIEAVEQAGQVVHLSIEPNETSMRADWLVPRSHYLEGWGDARLADRTHALVQPLIQPLFESRSEIELLARLAGETADGYEQVRRTFFADGRGEKAWRQALHDGFVAGSAAEAYEPALTGATIEPTPRTDEQIMGHQVVFRRDYKVRDGRAANNGWLQELPDPITKLTWDNAAYLSPADAERDGLALGDMLRITIGETSVEVPVYTLPGQAEGTITLTVGYGREAIGPVGRGVGVDVYPLLRANGGEAIAVDATIEKADRRYDLVTTQDHFAIDAVGDRTRDHRVRTELIRTATVEYYKQHPKFVYTQHGGHTITVDEPTEPAHAPGEPVEDEAHPTTDPDYHAGPAHEPHMEEDPRPRGYSTARKPQQWENPLDHLQEASDYQWGMVIDLNTCTGCNACVVACQAENNIPIVGKSQVAMNREMHWLRVDRYFKGDPMRADSVAAAHQPLACVHCENAPCESVCPVAATVHDSEGLNVMVYNRCIGTRYCSNNCPYKVRRFNYFDWHTRNPRNSGNTPPYLGMPDQEQQDEVGPIERLKFNPDVTVRMRGVMEKCTYCIQRIQTAKQQAYTEGRKVRDGEIETACQQTCPADAIVFGNLKDPDSAVAKQYYGNRRAYTLLDSYNTRPRTAYLGKVTNPLAPGGEQDGGAPAQHQEEEHG